MKLLDTSVAIDHLRGSPPAVKLLSGLLEAEESLLAGEVVRFELLAGVRLGAISSPTGTQEITAKNRSSASTSSHAPAQPWDAGHPL